MFERVDSAEGQQFDLTTLWHRLRALTSPVYYFAVNDPEHIARCAYCSEEELHEALKSKSWLILEDEPSYLGHVSDPEPSDERRSYPGDGFDEEPF